MDAPVPPAASAPVGPFTPLERALVDGWQRGFPLSPTPWDDIAAALGTDAAAILAAVERLSAQGVLSRVGPVIRPRRVGASTLAALAVPPDRMADVAAVVSAHASVNHNYERDHAWNLWFVVTAADAAAVADVLDDIRARTGLAPLDLPLEEEYHIDLGFRVDWP